MTLFSVASPVVLLIAGLVVCFLGYRLLRFTLGLAGFCVGLALGLAVAGIIAGASHVFTIILGIVCGIVGAVLATVLYKVGVFLLGAGVGALVASIITTAAGWHYTMLAALLGAVLGGVLTLVLERPLISVLSAFAGGWGIALGAFRLLGLQQATDGAKSPPANYGLLIVCWLVLGLIGAGVQLRSSGRKKKAEG
jgi:hypothetical protein